MLDLGRLPAMCYKARLMFSGRAAIPRDRCMCRRGGWAIRDDRRMKNFGRALRLATEHRWLLAGTIFCALMVGVLWGGNISAVYPFAAVAFEGRSLPQWIDDEVARAEDNLQQLDHQRQDLQAQLEAATEVDERDEVRRELGLLQTRRKAEAKALDRYRQAQPFVARYAPDGPFDTLVLLVGLLLLGTFIKSVFFVAQSLLVARLAHLTTFKLRNEFYRKSLRMDLGSFNEDGSAELMSRFTYDMESLSAGLRNLFGKAIREPLKMAACFVGAAWICWRLLLISLIVAPLAALAIGWLAKALKRANRRAMEEMSQLYGVLEETFGGIKIVKAFTMERTERRRFHQNNKKYYRKALKIARYDAFTRPLTETMGIATICLAILFGAYLVLNQQTHLLGIRITNRPLDLNQLLVFFAMLIGTSDPARKLSEVFARITRAAAACDRIYALVDRTPSIRDPVKPAPLPRHSRELVLRDVHFGYNESTPILHGIDLRIPFGETVAIVGPNGCGKSTLVSLVPRFFDVQHGSVEVDGVDVRNVRVRDLRRQVGLVTQETLLFNDTILDNIRYGSPDATREEVIAAAKQAHAHRFIEEQLDDGYDTLVGPRGGRLSGGQRQRIALARAILRDPAILILDEATSQVDLESEQVIHSVIAQFIQHRTALIITHRLSTLTLADRIVVMEAGQICDIGSHEQLLARCPLYARLHELQFRRSA